MKKTILLLLLSLVTSVSFGQSKEEREAVDFLNKYFLPGNIYSNSSTTFEGDLKIDQKNIQLFQHIKTFHPFDSDELTTEIKYDVAFNKSNIKDYFSEIEEIDKEKGLYKIFVQINFKSRLPMNYLSKMYLGEDSVEEKVKDVIKLQITNSIPVEKENLEEYKKAIELLFKV